MESDIADVQDGVVLVKVVSCVHCMASTVVRLGEPYGEAAKRIRHYKFCPKTPTHLTIPTSGEKE